MVALVENFEISSPLLETHGVAIPYVADVITPAIHAAIVSGRFEAEEAAELPGIVEEGDRILEIGAGIGFISTLLARDPRVEQVFAYEANPDLMGYMADLHALNQVHTVERRNAVLTNDGDTKKTFYKRNDFWMGSLSKGPNPYESEIVVPTAPLNMVLKSKRISMIVCDIEGAESFLFEDVDFADVSRVYLELHDHVTGLKGVARLFSAMEERGFAYDPRHSSRSIVLFRKVEENEVIRPYQG